MTPLQEEHMFSAPSCKKFDSEHEFIARVKKVTITVLPQKYQQKPLLYGLDVRFLGQMLSNVTFKDIPFSNFTLGEFTFFECTFYNCGFIALHFIGCHFVNCKFINCNGDYGSFYYSNFYNSAFDKCSFYTQFLFYNNTFAKTKFSRCELLHCIWQNRSVIKQSLRIENSTVQECTFDQLMLVKSFINNCIFHSNDFIRCTLGERTFGSKVYVPGKAYNSLDILTLIQSDTLSLTVLKNIFGVNDPSIKDYLIPTMSKIKFQKVFISYSLKDKLFAKRLSDALFEYGVVNYLFEKHAVSGDSIQEIMHEKQREFDRLLFIASENSLKSRPCHTELTEGRERQNKNWEKIFFPVRIDDYIFKVEKHQILDEENKEEFWKNIQTLKKFVIEDFSAFKGNIIPKKDWDKAVVKLIKALKL